MKDKRKQWYFIFFLIGIISFPLGLFLGENVFGLEGVSTVYFILLTFTILFTIGLYFSKLRSLGFAFKALAISFITLFLIFGAFFMWSAHEHYYAKAIFIDKLHDIPSEYVNITEKELEEYPALKKAISGNECIKFDEDSWYLKVHPDEWKRTADFLSEKGSYIIKVGEEYYRVRFATA